MQPQFLRQHGSGFVNMDILESGRVVDKKSVKMQGATYKNSLWGVKPDFECLLRRANKVMNNLYAIEIKYNIQIFFADR